MRISDWSSDVCSSDLRADGAAGQRLLREPRGRAAEDRHAIGTRAGSGAPFHRSGADRARHPHHGERHPAARRQLPFRGARSAAELWVRSEEHTSELQSLMRISYAVFCLKKKTIEHYTAHMTYV